MDGLTLLAITTSSGSRVAWLGAILGLMPFLVTIAAFTSILGAITREMAHLIALATLDSLSRPRLSALISLMSRLFAVATGKRIVASLGAVTGAVSYFITVDALDSDTLDFCFLLGTSACSMTKLYQAHLVHFLYRESC